MAFTTFDGDGWYGFSIIFFFAGDFLFFFFQLFEDVLGIEEICLALHSYLVSGISFLAPYGSMTLENVHYKCNCFHEESNFFF